ncbi:methyltransferase domain-containing protein [Vibrio harveyi]|uniref:class I SAM-dependent methyltransferase n=1 Tax=Vibrio harveyi TaxID=669 RepID=UPI001263572C|nr:class I SAM-dependent methyltransferase [Vibrio harveyi]ELV8772157.1 methyltransferase domain-containing protein [Vibrio harveyi]QFQ80218.1 methyltransferase domain-containing protein [Vibrio harveyi]HDM8137028.1 methyltransferase domain-containing protein [Vibrio harveyi]
MKWLDRLRIAHYHRKRHKQFGEDRARTLGWQDTFSQVTRFEALCRDLDLNGKSILDIGCGYGDLLAYIEQKGNSPSHYIGIDQQKRFIVESRKRHFITDTQFIRGDFSNLILPKAHYVFASGSLNYQSSNPNHTIEMIEKMYQTASIACVFNLLDEAKLPSMRMLESHNKDGVLRYCKLLNERSYLIEGYSDHDFTIVMPK